MSCRAGHLPPMGGEHAAYHARYACGLSVRQARVDRNLHRAGSAMCPGGACRLDPRARKQLEVAADVDVQRLDVDSSSDAPDDELVALRSVHTVLIVNVRSIGRYGGDRDARQPAERLIHHTRVPPRALGPRFEAIERGEADGGLDVGKALRI